jgi:hypothetical protein
MLEVKSFCGAQQSEAGSVFVPPQTESYQHDTDGNLTQDGRWNCTWDAENRLGQMLRDAASPSSANQKLVFEYDHQGRRIRKTFSITNAFVAYDGNGNGRECGGLAGLIAAAESAAIRKYDTVYSTVSKEYGMWDMGPVSWSMGATYYKPGESRKISDQTCKPRLMMLNADQLKALTSGLYPTFTGIRAGYEGPEVCTVTVDKK